MNWKSIEINILKQKKILNILLVVVFLALIIFSSVIRVQNLPLLKDQITGEYIPLALDPFYFLRLAETINEQGSLPAFDVMRHSIMQTGFTDEILPQVVVLLHKISGVFGDYSLQYIHVIYPVIFFVLGLIVFFLLVYVLTNSKLTALISSAFLAVIPSFLHRTQAGFADHEAIGIFAFFLALLCYGLALKYLEKKDKKTVPISFGLIVGFVSAFTIASWGGVANFLFIIIPISFFIFWLLKVKNQENKLSNFVLFYLVWFFSSILCGIFFGYPWISIINRFLLSYTGLVSSFVLGFIVIDYATIKFKFLKSEKLQKYRVLFSGGITVVLGIIFLFILGQNLFSLISEIFHRLLHPFGAGRVGLTVAENKQPYLAGWISQIGKTFFWVFYLGLVFVGTEISKKFSEKKYQILFVFFWVLMISGILFSRISDSSILNGTTFISQLFYFGSLILFIGYCVWLYFHDEIKIKTGLLLLSVWLFSMLIAGRGALRLFFVVTPFVCLMVGYSLVRLFNYAKNRKEELSRMFLFIILILAVIGAIFSFINFANSTIQQAKYTGPSANFQWQKAMSWVRENTLENTIFVSWWDYGYWIQYLGKRPTLADGGQFQGGFRTHMIGRYILTTPKPETTLSFMKSNNVSYLLIDPTDIGKYPAYSKIGSDKEWDRFSWIPTVISPKEQIQETRDGMVRVYQVGILLDEDIIYELNGDMVFLPGGKAFVGAVILEINLDGNQVSFNQPQGIFVHNEKQINIPLRYLYVDKRMMDFGTGVNSTIYVVPRIYQENQGIQIDSFGGAFYLSPKVSNSLFAQLYLFDDPFNKYPTIKLVHAEPDPLVSDLNAQGANLNEFAFFNGVRGPIKIWETDYPENIIEREEFLRREGEYGEFDNLVVVK